MPILASAIYTAFELMRLKLQYCLYVLANNSKQQSDNLKKYLFLHRPPILKFVV